MPQLINAATTHLRINSFELKLLNFFHAACVPLFSFNVDKESHEIWDVGIRPHFVSSGCVRNGVFAVACLMLWPRQNVQKSLTMEKPPTFLSKRHDKKDFAHVYRPVGEGDHPEENLLATTVRYFDQNLTCTQAHIQEIHLQPFYTATQVNPLFYNGSLTYVYVGLNPNIVMPFFDPYSETPMDLLQYAVNYTQLFAGAIRDNPLLPHMGDPLVHYRVKQFVNFERRTKKSNFVQKLRYQLTKFYYGDTAFLEITSRSCYEYAVFDEHLNYLEFVVTEARRLGIPVPIFEWPFTVSKNFVQLARQHNEFALRILLAFASLSLYSGFFLIKTSNLWLHYIQWFTSRELPICDFDARLLEIVLADFKPDLTNFGPFLERFENMWADISPEEQEVLDVENLAGLFPIM
ncbi:hypothetical protein PUMCH_000834 [Australozyma saopauloensis]|uniref:Uncharacterized protein n=1 Tax=Australozyma saopauloensis TaxID=291208 RepID=A0AAX4H539_9ASCO|nr:hypothetical protein PUMCH_000834 [[Candida] saopauloensis]